MKTTRTMMSLALAAALVGGGVVAGTAYAGNGPWDTGTVASTTVTGTLDDQATKDLQFTREEERMARDLYAALAEKYDDALPFSRITNSEQRHYDAVGTLLDRYGVSDPSDGLKAGEYADATIQKLYDDWYAQGSVSLDAAYDVGIALEKRDIADLEKAVAAATQDDVKRVYEALLNGSEHHLAAFEAAAAGETLGTQDGQGLMQGQQGRQGQGRGGMGGPGMRQGVTDDDSTRGFGPGQGKGMQAREPGTGLGDCPYVDDDDS